jgi:hypothetical protein
MRLKNIHVSKAPAGVAEVGKDHVFVERDFEKNDLNE